MLDINFQSIYENNKITTTEYANMFGLSLNGDGATIKRISLLNILAMCSSKPPAFIEFLDFNGHMVDGGKKMLNSSCPISNKRLMNLIQKKHLMTPSSLMGQQMFQILWTHFL